MRSHVELWLFHAVTFVLNTTLAPAFGLPLNPEAAKQGEKLLSSSLSTIESLWLKGDAKFLLGNPQPSIADLSLVCEIMQLEVLILSTAQIMLLWYILCDYAWYFSSQAMKCWLRSGWEQKTTYVSRYFYCEAILILDKMTSIPLNVTSLAIPPVKYDLNFYVLKFLFLV